MYSLSFEGTKELPQPQVTLAMEQHGGGVRTSGKPAASPGHQANSLAAVPRVWSPGHRTLRPSHIPYADLLLRLSGRVVRVHPGEADPLYVQTNQTSEPLRRLRAERGQS